MKMRASISTVVVLLALWMNMKLEAVAADNRFVRQGKVTTHENAMVVQREGDEMPYSARFMQDKDIAEN